jgi:hypothetical protein
VILLSLSPFRYPSLLRAHVVLHVIHYYTRIVLKEVLYTAIDSTAAHSGASTLYSGVVVTTLKRQQMLSLKYINQKCTCLEDILPLADGGKFHLRTGLKVGVPKGHLKEARF